VPLHCRNECEFARAGFTSISQQPDWSCISLGHETRQRKDVDEFAATALMRTAEFSVEEALSHPRSESVYGRITTMETA
jgi:hypothetical protein